VAWYSENFGFYIVDGITIVITVLEARLADTEIVMQTNENGRTLLFCASETGAYKSAEILLKKGIDPNLKDEHNLTAMNVLIRKEAMSSLGVVEHDFIKTAILLMQYGSNANEKDRYGNTLLLSTRSLKIIRLLLSYGADANSANKDGDTALFYFAKGTYAYSDIKMSILKSLVDNSADFEAIDKEGKSVFDYLHGEVKYDFYKQTRYPKKLESKTVKEFLILAMKNHDYTMVELLLNMGDYANERDGYYKQAFVFKAIDDSKIVEIFFKHGLDINITSHPKSRKSLLSKAIDRCAVESIKLILDYQEKDLENFQTIAKTVHCKDADTSIQIFDLLFSKGVGTTITDNKGHTLLHLAAKESKDRLCQYFLDKGMDVNIKDKEGATPLLYALLTDDDRCAKILLKSGADIHYKMPKNITLLHVAVKGNNIVMVKKLLEQGFDPNETDKEGHNVLQLAAKNSNLDMMKLLLEKGANIKAVDLDGDSVLHYACGWNDPIAVAKFLIAKGLNVNLKNKKGQTTLYVAINNDNLATTLYLLEHKANINIQDNNGDTPLHFAIKESNKKMVTLLLLKGADQSIMNKEGLSALELANKEHSYDKEEYQKVLSGKYQSYLLDEKSIFSFKSLDDIVLYMGNSGNLKIRNKNGESLLHIAAKEYGNAEIIDYLLALGINPDLKDSEGRTALHLAAQFASKEGVHSLLQYGAKIDIKDKNQLTPADYAVVDMKKRKDYLLPILKDMLAHGLVIIPWKNSKGEFLLNGVSDKPELLSFLIKHEGDVNSVQKDGDTSLITSAVHNYEKSAKVLIDAGAKIDIQNKRGRTALYTSTVLKSYEIAEILLENGANINLQTKDGDTSLLNAVRKNDYKMVSLLLKYNLDPNISNKQKDTALHMAVMNRNEMMVKALLEKKADPDLKDDLGLKPLDYAKRLKLKQMLVLLEAVTNVKDDVPSHNVVIKEEKKSENNILSVKAEDKNVAKYEQSKLHQAVSVKNLDAVKHLLENHTEIDIVDKLGRTPLHYAAIRGYIEIAELLLDRGANINAVDSSKQWTPLFYATFMGHQKMIELLMAKGADVTLKDKFNRTVDDYKKDK